MGWDLRQWGDTWEALGRGISWRVIRDAEKPVRMTCHEFTGNLHPSQGISASRWGVGHRFCLEVGVRMGTPIPEAVKKVTLV